MVKIMKPTLKTFIMQSGERYCLLVDRDNGIPLFYPNLYITTQVRNRSLSYSAMEAALTGITVLLSYLAEKNQNIEHRFRQANFFYDYELDAIRDYCQIKFKQPFSENQTNFKNATNSISNETQYSRITTIAHYTKWLAMQLLSNNQDQELTLSIKNMETGFKTRRPPKKKRNIETIEKGLSQEQIDLLFEIFRPDSELNPFKASSLKNRNRLIVLMLYHLGLRGGELLNIKIADIDFSKNQLLIARRADEKKDPRKYQPLVKTLDRRLPLKDTLVKEIHNYILKDRKKIPNANKNEYLFITHKPGKYQGQPLSKSAYKRVLSLVRELSPTLYNLTGHQLRHSWNEAFSNRMDTMDNPPNPEQQEKIRSYLMGWKENSGTASTYNKRFIKQKAQEAALDLQNGLIRIPRSNDVD